jgi:signal transduction histidine kinase/phage shock protein PspC (stress-responsive transcriptional regulator)
MTIPAPYTPRRATRDTTDTYLGGVASGLARHLGVPVIWLRAGFIGGAALGGVGIALYAGLWLVLPSDDKFSDAAPGLASATRTGKRAQPVRRLADMGPTIALAALAIGVVLMFETAFGRGALFWPIVLGIGGVALIWRQADEAQRERWLDTTGRIDPVRAMLGSGGWASYARLVAGGVLIISALGVFALRSGRFDVAADVVVAGLLGIAGLAITVGPWVYRLASDLGNERAERVRSQERADVAAHLHDSVLQTLALIQKNAADASTVARLARAQERDLRTWLFEGDGPAGTLSAALREIAADVEADHAIVVEVVTVGDLPVDELLPLVHATREAVVNAAKHAGVPQVDVYAEVSPYAVEVFVKDRGAGFDPERIAGDRQGLRGSIVDRMERHGGTAHVKSTPGAGTEIVLRMPLEENR